jgi:hypothetical protein
MLPRFVLCGDHFFVVALCEKGLLNGFAACRIFLNLGTVEVRRLDTAVGTFLTSISLS